MTEDRLLKIALVDDSPLIRERVTDLLSGIDGLAVIWEAASVTAGRGLFQIERPDVLILDIELSGESGLDLLRLANLEPHPPITMMITNEDYSRLRERCAELGADYFFYKPTELYKTIDACRAMAQHHRRGPALEPARQHARLKELAGDCLAALRLNPDSNPNPVVTDRSPGASPHSLTVIS